MDKVQRIDRSYEKKLREKLRRRTADNIKMDLQGILYEHGDWSEVALHRVRRGAFVNKMMKRCVFSKVGINFLFGMTTKHSMKNFYYDIRKKNMIKHN
jgi:hypothetical protein